MYNESVVGAPMIDSEVERLRRLREVALRVRAVGRALAACKAGRGNGLLRRGRCVAWRVARTVTGRLRAHPYAPFTRDASLGVILRNGVIAKVLALSVANRADALQKLEAQMRALGRELDDARALTWAADLSDTFGRSQAEIRSLLGAIQASVLATPARVAVAPPAIVAAGLAGAAATSSGASPVAAARAVRESRWPFVAF